MHPLTGKIWEFVKLVLAEDRRAIQKLGKEILEKGKKIRKSLKRYVEENIRMGSHEGITQVLFQSRSNEPIFKETLPGIDSLMPH